jgi:hypothetical protein
MAKLEAFRRVDVKCDRAQQVAQGLVTS